jgi:transposase
MWTQAHRETQKQSGRGLPSDLTDAQWERLEPLIPAAKPGGRPRTMDMRAAMNAIFYLLRTGCPCGICRAARFLRARRSTISSGSSARRGLGAHLGRTSYGAARGARPRGRPHRRDHRQPVAESGGKGGAASRSEKNAVGYDAGKKVKGRKIHALVDVEGLPLHVIVHSAGIQDRDGAVLVLDKIASAFHGWNLFGPTQATTPIRSRMPWPDRRGSGSKSSSASMTSKASSSCPGDGSSSEPSHGSAATAVSPKTTRTSQKLLPPS